MEIGSIVEFLENRSILITGVTGFVAKLFVEKVLRVQPNVKKLYLLIRAADAETASERFRNEIIGKELFKTLKEKFGENFNSFIMEKITLVRGDVSIENFGVTDTDLLEEMCREIHVVVNMAATTSFDGRYDAALRTNSFGAKHVLNFSKKCTELKILVHVSTAYVAGEPEGSVKESPCDLGSESLNGVILDMENNVVEKRLAELQNEGAKEEEITAAMKDLGAQRATKYGWPNAYVFTKAIAEIYLGRMKENIPLVILRPTIITSTYKDPFPGWIEGLRTLDSIALSYGKGKVTTFLLGQEAILDVIPGDMVVNSIFVAMVAHANHPYHEQFIYHIGSSVANPMTMKSLIDYIESYFMENPLVGKDGKSIKVDKFNMLTSMDAFYKYMNIRYKYPLEGTCVDLNRKLNFVMRLAEIYRPYIFFKGIFDDTNTKKLQLAAKKRGIDIHIFDFDPEIMNWDDYFANIHFPGLIKYVMRH